MHSYGGVTYIWCRASQIVVVGRIDHNDPEKVLIKIQTRGCRCHRQLSRPVQGGDDLLQHCGEVFALDFIDAPAGFKFGDSVLQLFLYLLHNLLHL